MSLSLTLNIFHNFFLLFLLLTLNRSLLAGNNCLNLYIFMLIIITHSMPINAVSNPYDSLEKIKENHRKMFSESNYMEQDPTKIVWLWWKLIEFRNICFLCKNYAVHNKNLKTRLRNIISSLYQLCLQKMDQYQTLKIKKKIKQVAPRK